MHAILCYNSLMAKKWEERQVSLGGTIISGVATLIVGFFLGMNWNNLAPKFLPYLGVRASVKNDWSELDDVYSMLVSNYDGEIDKDVIIEGAKKGLVAAVGDVYTEYMTTEEAEAYEAALHGDVGAGIGIEMGLRDGYVRVIRTLPDNPAGKAGVKAGDIIYKIDDEEVYDKTTDEISQKLRGAAGTKVKLTVARDGEEKSFELTRETINNVSAYVTYDGSTAIITVTRFDNDTGTLVQNIVKNEFEEKGVKKVILDLRNNGGGYVSAAKDLLSLWIDGEPVLIQKSNNLADETTRANRGQAKLSDMSTVVLINGSTASASEIVAGALKDYDKATVLGETSYGKGVVQTLLDLPENTLLKVTTARWYTPKGNSINGEGIKPDIEVELTYDDANHSRDPQLDAAKKHNP